MSAQSSRVVVAFSCVGHAFSHMFEPIFYVVALVLPAELGLSYGEVLALVIAGKLLYGLAAPVAGWLGDRWSSVGMMALYFLGSAAGAVLTGLATTPWQVASGLAVIGLFGSIYHPVGTAWLVRHSENPGRALGLIGVFGGLGPALAGLAAGWLTDWSGWRAAFIVPGVVTGATGVAFLVLMRWGVVADAKPEVHHEPRPPSADAVRVYMVMTLTLLCGGIIYQAIQAALPKLFEQNLDGAMGNGLVAVGTAVMLVYGVSGLLQIVSGHLTDRYRPRTIYIVLLFVQVPLLYLTGVATGLPLVVLAFLMVSANIGLLPAENVLFARYAPTRWRGTAFGVKFILSFGVSTLAVPMVSLIHGATGGFTWLFAVLAALAAIAAAGALMLPPDRGFRSSISA